jgi:hypothetical protein
MCSSLHFLTGASSFYRRGLCSVNFSFLKSKRTFKCELLKSNRPEMKEYEINVIMSIRFRK